MEKVFFHSFFSQLPLTNLNFFISCKYCEWRGGEFLLQVGNAVPWSTNFSKIFVKKFVQKEVTVIEKQVLRNQSERADLHGKAESLSLGILATQQTLLFYFYFCIDGT